ncbi:MAG TPA: hypothetical protein VFN68_02980 [Acidimicrobiales bacterium]|nr:hypothetical protein [Acidimicrobiales bacterium]
MDPSTQQQPQPAQVFLRPLGTPLPLGMVGLAVATSVLACLNLGWIPTSEQHQVALVLFAFAFPLQLVATVLLFLARDAPAGAGIGVQSVTWLALGLLLFTGKPGVLSATVSVFLFAAAAAVLPAVVTSSLGKLVPAAVMGATSLRYVLTGLYEHFGGTAWEHAAGWEGIVLAGLALYCAFASDLESQLHRTVLPMGRHGSGRRALQQDLADQLPELHSEPGVRPQI